MALVLEHFRSIPPDIYSTMQASSDAIPVLVGCVTTAATHRGALDEESVLDLVVRASERVVEVMKITSWLAETRPVAGRDAIRDSLSALQVTLRVLEDSWVDIAPDERQGLLRYALRSLARFCYLSRPAGSVAMT